MCVDPDRGGPRFTLEGYRHPVDQRPSDERRPEMMCNFCRDTRYAVSNVVAVSARAGR